MGNSKAVQALRGLSALSVVLLHANISFFGTGHYWPDQPAGHLVDFGHAGVEFFFVLSGFIIYTAHRNDIGKPARLTHFLWKRFRRIYPIYWVVLGLTLPMFFLAPSMGSGEERQPGLIVDSVLLVHLFADGQIVSVSWTLFHEIAFYAVFAVMIANRAFGVVTIALWTASSAVSLAVPEALSFTLSPLHVLFAMGLVAAWLIGRRHVVLPGLVLSCGLLFFVATAVDEVLGRHMTGDMVSVCYGLASSFILVGAVELERGGRLRISRAMILLGDASYSIYLVHVVAMSVLAKIALAVMARVAVPHLVTYAALVVGALAIGLLFHLLVELPLLGLLGHARFSAKPVGHGHAPSPDRLPGGLGA